MTTEPFPLIHHSTMLADLARLDLYKQSIKEMVNTDSIVVDIGSGTGILSHYAALQGAKKVYGIEYITSTYEVSCEIAKNRFRDKIHFFNARSYDIKLDCNPTLLLTETIGPIGTEENIVELCYDFYVRHPSIENIIPHSLCLYAQPFYSEILEQRYARSLSNYYIKDCESFIVSDCLKKKFHDLYCCILIQAYLSDAMPIGDAIPIMNYTLGIDSHSMFEKELKVSNYTGANGIYLYFEANLTKNIQIKNHFLSNKLHWVPYYFKKSLNSDSATLIYNSKTKKFSVTWN